MGGDENDICIGQKSLPTKVLRNSKGPVENYTNVKDEVRYFQRRRKLS